MSNAGKFEVEGIVTEAVKGGKFLVKINDSDMTVECTTSGRLKKNFIKIIVGDKVTVNISSYDVTKGIITWRDK